MWQHDKTIWTGTDEDKWLGWLNSVSAEKSKLASYLDFAKWVKQQGFSDAVVLGMGGSSLGPEVIAENFGQQPGFPKLHVLDSTDAAQVRALGSAVNIAKTLFIVSSKSGGTTEPNVMKDYFFAEVSAAIGAGKAGGHFVAVTDPARRWKKSEVGFPASSTATRPSAAATRCCRHSGWCRLQLQASTLRSFSISRLRWSVPADRMCRRTKTPAYSLASQWESPAAMAATR